MNIHLIIHLLPINSQPIPQDKQCKNDIRERVSIVQDQSLSYVILFYMLMKEG